MEITNVVKQDLGAMSVQTASAKQETNETAQANIKTESAEIMKNSNENRNNEGYTAVSQDGDTVKISRNSRDENAVDKKIKISESKNLNVTMKMTDSALMKCSKSKLKQLLQNGQISKSQYEKAMKKVQG